MKQRNVSSITSMMLLVLMPYLFSARMGVAVMASGDHEAPFIRAGQQQQQQDHGEDELWEANFTAKKRDLVSVFRCLLIQRSIHVLFSFSSLSAYFTILPTSSASALNIHLDFFFPLDVGCQNEEGAVAATAK
jgi:hypothetical protein